MPNPAAGENQSDFVARCIRLVTKEDPNRNKRQIIAICFDKWKSKKKASTMPQQKYKQDEDGHYIIAENVPIIFNSVMNPTSDIITESPEEDIQNAGQDEENEGKGKD